MTEDLDNVTPEYLLSHGFEKYDENDQYDIHECPFINNDHLHFREKEFDRNMFVVIFSQDMEDKNHMHHQIYVQEDAGCGFTCIPERWWDLPIEYFEAIYFGIRGDKPKEITNL